MGNFLYNILFIKMKFNVFLLGIAAATQSTILLEAPNQLPVHSPELVVTDSEELRLKKVKADKRTTLTIVQDFPKKPTDSAPTMNLIQGKSKAGDIKIETDPRKKTVLTIAQDFPKKPAQHK